MNFRSFACLLMLAPLLPAAVQAQELPNDKAVYEKNCAACHATGAAGAPKLGDASAWAPRIGAGAGPLYASATKGKGAMPAKGGNASLPDADVRAAVDFMLAQARGGTASSTPSTPTPATTVAVSLPPAAPTRPAPQGSTDPNAFNRLMPAPATRNPPPTEDGIHDPANPGTALLQTPAAAFGPLPRGNAGNYVNWVTALAKNQIPARWDARDPNAAATVMDLNIVREVKGSMPDVVFPHKQHTEWLDCSNCHPAIFTPQKGSNQISMAAIMLGQKCGVCHGRVAFPISECRLCHTRQKTAAVRAAEAGPVAGGRP